MTMSIGNLAKPRHGGPAVRRSWSGVKERGEIVDPGYLIGTRGSPCDFFDGGAEPQGGRHIQAIAGILKPEAALFRRSGLHSRRQLGPTIRLRGTRGKMDPELVKMRHADNLIRFSRNGADRGKEERHENSQDPHDHDQLGKSESNTGGVRASQHWVDMLAIRWRSFKFSL